MISKSELERILSKYKTTKEAAFGEGINPNTLRGWMSKLGVTKQQECVGFVGNPKNVLALPDLHLPFHDWKALEWAASLVEVYNIGKVVQLGDLIDGYSWSRWDKDPDADSPQREYDKMRLAMFRLNKLFPNMTVLLGNHCTRITSRALGAGIPIDLIKGLNELFPFDGWEWHLDRGKPYIYEGMAFLHGDEVAGGLNVSLAAERLGMSAVFGHSHQGRLMYSQSTVQSRFGMSCGCLVDVDAYSMRYSKLNANKVWLGVGIILDGVPHLIPYPGGR